MRIRTVLLVVLLAGCASDGRNLEPGVHDATAVRAAMGTPKEILKAPSAAGSGTEGTASGADPQLATVGKSTGPRTAKGKAVVSRNADKGGTWRLLRELRRALREQDKLRQDVQSGVLSF